MLHELALLTTASAMTTLESNGIIVGLLLMMIGLPTDQPACGTAGWFCYDLSTGPAGDYGRRQRSRTIVISLHHLVALEV
jgi:hypothetical protein